MPIEVDGANVRRIMRAARKLADQGDFAIMRDADGVHWMKLARVARAAHMSPTAAALLIRRYVGHHELVPVRRLGTPLDEPSLARWAEKDDLDLALMVADTTKRPVAEQDAQIVRAECALLVADEPSAFRVSYDNRLRFVTRVASERAGRYDPGKRGSSIARMGLWDQTGARERNWPRFGRPLTARRFFQWLNEQGIDPAPVADALGKLERVGKKPPEKPLNGLRSRAKAQRAMLAGFADADEQDARKCRLLGEVDKAAELERRARENRTLVAIKDDLQFLIEADVGLPPVENPDGTWRDTTPEDWRST